MGGNGSGNSIECWGPDQVLQQYDLHTSGRDVVYYSIWQGSALKYVFDSGNGADGLHILTENLTAWEQNGNSATYTIRFHPALSKWGTIDNSTPYNGSVNFKLSQPASKTIAGVTPSNPQLDKIMEVVALQQEQITQILAALAEPEDADYEMAEPEPDAVGDVIGQIQRVEDAIIKSPVFGGFFEDLKYGFRHWLKKQGVELPAMRSPETAINGTNQSSNMSNTTTQEDSGRTVDMSKVMRELVAAWPELPGILVKLHSIWEKDKEEFKYITKKLNEKVNDL